MEENDKNNQEIIEKLNLEASQAKIALANSAIDNEEKIREYKIKIKKLTSKLESLDVKLKNI